MDELRIQQGYDEMPVVETLRYRGMTRKRTAVFIIGIVAILLLITLVSVPVWGPDRRLKSAAGDLYANLQLAKNSAIKRGANCTITFYQDVPPLGGPSYDYVIYFDSNNDLILDNDEEVITKVFFADYEGVDLDTSRGDGIGVDFPPKDGPNLPSIAFLPNGLTMDSTGGFVGGKVFLRDSRNKTVELLISTEGDIRVR